MGLNVNYNLLIEGNNSTSIPEYKRYYTPGFFMESEFVTCIAEFNQEIRESRHFLSTLYEVESVNESTAAVNIVNGIRFVAEKAKKAFMNVMTMILDAFKKAIESVEKMISDRRASKIEKIRMNERISILKKAFSEEEISVSIASIDPTKDLLDKSFPDTSIIGSDLVKMATDTMNNYCINIVQKDGADASLLNDTEVKASASFVSFIEGEKNKMLSQIFGRYSYDETAISKSAQEVADQAFGSNEKKDTKLTDSLYLAACDNLEQNSLNSIVKDMKAQMDEASKAYKAVTLEMDSISDSVKHFDKMVSNKYNVTMKERYYTATKTIIERVNRALNVIQQVVNADFTLVTKKAARVYAIYGIAGDSAKVKNKCDSIILKTVAAKVGYNNVEFSIKAATTESAKYFDYDRRINEASAGVSRNDAIDKVVKALADNGLKAHISKSSEWGSNNFLSGKDNCLCLGSFNKDTFNKAYKVVKEALPDGYRCSKDNYFTLFIYAPKMIKEDYDVVNGREEIEDISQIQEKFLIASTMAEEAFNEEAYTEVVMGTILEAEGDQNNGEASTNNGNNTNTNNNNTPQATETTVSQKTNIVKKAGSAVWEFVQKLIASFGQAMQRFRNRIDELIIKNPLNQKYWHDNKDNIQKMALTDTKVNEWYSYNIDYFANSTFIKFDQNNADLKNDESFQNAIMKKITNNGALPKFDEKDSFAQKINKIYQGEFFKDDNGDGKTLQEVNYNHGKAFGLVDEMMTRGFGGNILGKVVNDYKDIDTDYKATQKNYDSIAAQMKPSVNQNASQNNVENQKTEPQNAAAMMTDDFRFNLAEHFGLIHNEASFTVGQNDAAVASANGADTKAEGNKELDAMIKRCYQYNTIAVTAKMTAAIGAYKQYMSLFKAVYKPAKKAPTNNQNAEQNNNNARQNGNENKK